MARLGDTLKFLVDADGQGAIREFDKIGKAARGRLGDVETGSGRLSAAIDKVTQRSPMAAKALDRMGLSSTEAAAAIGAMAPAAALAGGVIVAKIGSDAVQAYSAFNEQASRSRVIFGEQSDAVAEFAQSAAQNLGISATAALNAQSTFGTFANAAGLGGDEAVQFSQSLTSLAGDLASFNDTSTDEAITAIGAALRGENEPIRRFGVLLDDATLRNKALQMGLIATTKQALTPAQKTMASYALILEQTGKAQGDFARTSDSVANAQRRQAATTADLKVKLGKQLEPTYRGLLAAGNDLVDVANDLSGAMADQGGSTDKAASGWDKARMALFGGAGALYAAGKAAKDAEAQVYDYAAAIEQMGVKTGEAQKWQDTVNRMTEDYEAKLADAEEATERLKRTEERRREVAIDALKRIRDEQDRNRQSILDTIEAVDDNARSYLDYLDQIDETKSAIDKYQGAVAEQADLEQAMPGLTKKAADATGRKEAATSDLASITDQLNGLDEEAERIRRAEVDGLISAEEADRQLEQVRRRKYDLTQRQAKAEQVLRDATREAEDAQDALGDAQERLSDLQENLNGLMRDAQRAILDQASAAGEGAAKNAALQTETGKAAAAALAQRDAYRALATEIGPGSALIGFMDGLIAKQQQAARQALVLSALTFSDTYARDAYNRATNLSGSIPMASGGIVMPKAGGTLARIGEAGRPEAVIPLPTGTAGTGAMGGMVNVTINMPPGANGQDVVDAIERWRRRGGRAGWMAA